MYRTIWYFFIYSFIGWCCEVSYAAMVEGRFVNRGFLCGPVCPIYGFGMLLIICVLYPYKSNKLLVFFGAMLLTSVLELSAGFVLERLFHQKWWDYSNIPFNLGGYICLKFSVLWGLAVLLVVELVHPLVSRLVGFIPRPVGWGLIGVMGAVILVDLAGTVLAMAHFNERLSQLSAVTAQIRAVSDKLGAGISGETLIIAGHAATVREGLERKRGELEDNETVVRLRERERELSGRLTHMQQRILKAFPGMQSKDHAEALERLRSALRGRGKSA